MDYMIGIHITVIISVLLLIRLAFPRKFGNVPGNFVFSGLGVVYRPFEAAVLGAFLIYHIESTLIMQHAYDGAASVDEDIDVAAVARV